VVDSVQISVRRYLLIAAACCSEPQQAFGYGAKIRGTSAFWDGSEGSHGWVPVTTHENAVAPTGAVRRQLQTRNLHFAVRPVPKVSYSEAFQERICLDYFFPFGPTRCVGVCHNEGRVGILHCR
jgi:hypothetical protein